LPQHLVAFGEISPGSRLRGRSRYGGAKARIGVRHVKASRRPGRRPHGPNALAVAGAGMTVVWPKPKDGTDIDPVAAGAAGSGARATGAPHEAVATASP
jgi:hypothetical protein